MAFYTKLFRFLYTLAYYLAIPAILLRLLVRSRKQIAYRKRWNERFGFITPLPSDAKSIWIHAVSVGETIAAVPLIKALKTRYPDYRLIVTTGTPTGSSQVINHFGNEVVHVYCPYDLPDCLNRFLNRGRIQFCIIMETEIWPNLLVSCRKFNVPIMLANARLSETSKENYKKLKNLMKVILAQYKSVAAQGVLDGERFVELGLDPKRLTIAGNIKFDIEIPESFIQQGKSLRQQWNAVDSPVIIAASTHEGEDEQILEAFKLIRHKIPNCLLLVAPRHTPGFESVKNLFSQAGFNTQSRSSYQHQETPSDVIVIDTIGELRFIFAACDLAFVGGSLVSKGGHNTIEPAAIGIPVITGPSVHNFQEITQTLKKAEVLQIVADAKTLAECVISLIENKELCLAIGAKAKKVIAENCGSVQKHLEIIDHCLKYPEHHISPKCFQHTN